MPRSLQFHFLCEGVANMIEARKKLIEVALPLEAINEGSKPETENPFLKWHPRGVHNWWARTPLSVCRAVLFAQLVDDPGDGLDTEQADEARAPMVDLVRRLGTWHATSDASVIDEARAAIMRQFDGQLPAFWDMFCGRGSISIEAQRLGLRVYSSDLNPVAVTIQKALLQYPQRFQGWPPVNPDARATLIGIAGWKNSGAEGLADDVRHYGQWIRGEAEKHIGHLYPKARLSDGSEATVIAWLWARTVASPNPAAKGAHVPLVRSFALSSKKANRAWVEPVIDRANNSYRFVIRTGSGRPPNGTVGRRGGRCLLTEAPISFAYIRAEGKAGGIGHRLMAMGVESTRGRFYLEPTRGMEAAAEEADPHWRPNTDLPEQALGFRVQLYGMTKHAHLFTDRQLAALGAFSDLVGEVREKVKRDYLDVTASDRDVSVGLNAAADSYADAIATYLACALSRMTDYHCALATWNPTNENVRNLFQRQAIPMAWDFAEANPVGGKLDFSVAVGWVAGSLRSVPAEREPAVVFQHDARSDDRSIDESAVISTDPPYYDILVTPISLTSSMYGYEDLLGRSIQNCSERFSRQRRQS